MADARDVKAKYRYHQIRGVMSGSKMSWPPAKDPAEVSKASGNKRIFTIKNEGTEAGGDLSLVRKRLKRHRKNHQDMMANRSIQAHKDAAQYNAYRAEKGMGVNDA